jgi:hypothetical protein
MFESLLKEVTGALDRRFVLTLFFPSLLFWAGLLVVYASTTDTAGLVTFWTAQSIELRTLEIVGALVWITFFAYVLWHQGLWLQQQFEGSWNWPLGRRLAARRAGYYRGVLRSLNTDDDRDRERIYYSFPLPEEEERVMPTRLGNILKNAVLYTLHQYGIDAVLMWPRLYPLLPDSFVAALARRKRRWI